MSKLIKTNDTDVSVEVSQINVVKIGTLSFEIEEGYPWIDVYFIGNEHKELLTEIDDKDVPTGLLEEEFKAYCLNWYFDNVEIVPKAELKK